MEKAVRTFIALELPSEAIRLASDLQERLAREGLKLRWVRPNNIHLTIRFLGEIAPERAEAVAAVLPEIAQGVAPLDLSLQGMGVFPGIRRPNVLWLGLGGQIDRLSQMHARLEDRLEALGMPRESRPFRAHLTLARIKLTH